jgi:hypothetical protein
MAHPLKSLTDAGVSIWLDDMSRLRLTSGSLRQLIDQRQVSGMTTNPTIFAKAIEGSDVYDEQLTDLARRRVDVGEALRAVTTYDVRAACDVLRPTFEATGGTDGRVAGPATVVLVASYFASFAAIGSPRSGWAQAASYLPVTAPMAMPNRVAMGATSWWEPVVAAAVAVATVGALVRLAGRVYVRAILHTGPTLKLREVWRGRAEGQGAVTSSGVESAGQGSRVVALGAGARRREIAAMVAGVVLAVVVGVITRDVVIGVAVGALLVAAARTGMRHGHR